MGLMLRTENKKLCDCVGTAKIIDKGVEYCPIYGTNHLALYTIEYDKTGSHRMRFATDSGRIKLVHDCREGKCGQEDV